MARVHATRFPSGETATCSTECARFSPPKTSSIWARSSPAGAGGVWAAAMAEMETAARTKQHPRENARGEHRGNFDENIRKSYQGSEEGIRAWIAGAARD